MTRHAGADWAFVSDASALAIVEVDEPAGPDVPVPLVRVVALEEIRNRGEPRDPRDVAAAFVRTLGRWDVSALCSDSHYRAAWQPVLADADVDWLPAPVSQAEIAETFLGLRTLVHSGRVVLPDSPRLAAQFADIEAQATSAGLKIKARRRRDASGGTSHGDLVSALALACWQALRPPAEYRHRGVPSRIGATDPRRRTEGGDPFFAETAAERNAMD